jgi:VWFA-related protein
MKRTRTVLAALTVFLLVLGIPLSLSRADTSHFVWFDVAVTDKNDNPVAGLEKNHFRVFENDVERVITEFDASVMPRAVVILVEFSDTFVNYHDNAAAPAAGFIRTLPPKDWTALVTFDIAPEIVNDFTRNKSALISTLQGLLMPFHRETSLYDAVYFALERMEGIEEKGAIFLLSSGVDTMSKRSYSETLKRAEASDTIIYSVGMGQFARTILEPYTEPGMQVSLFQADNVMRSLAEATGGLSFFPRFSGEYPGIYEIVNADLSHRYTLGFVSTNPRVDGKLNKLKVEVVNTDVDHDGKPDKLKVRHKRGYYAPTSRG